MAVTTAHREAGFARKARDVADRVAGTLRSPDVLDTLVDDPGDVLSFADGFSGISLLFTARAAEGIESRTVAHAYLQRAAAAVSRVYPRNPGLYLETAGLAFALDAAASVGGGYGKALATVDQALIEVVEERCRDIEENPLGPFHRYDVIGGLTGAGRHLLGRAPEHLPTLERVLGALVSLTRSLRYHGETVPALWATHPPNLRSENPYSTRKYGHLNTGLSHGIAGPLALLSLAHARGVAVPGHERAVRTLVALLERLAREDEFGVHWPNAVSLDEWAGVRRAMGRARPSWCYGAPGIARALQLAGEAFGEPGWTALATESVGSFLKVPMEHWAIDHWSLCHGWSGLLHLLRFFRDSAEADRVHHATEDIARRLVTGLADPEALRITTFRETAAPRHGWTTPGFLTGATGLALALHAYASGEPPVAWDAALLVA
ncbi:lanthionine synthetase C family protein [Streptomyces sp. PT12]|uniref:lanthionine synthetase C family protein n=1 Tax=Streptomyces sp. PT12 TaxID=1510197 RepID=UPI000DE44719|nr:lanthionine synthetase C family protein [Streptomyces sp. PT12]RBM11830.1 hypothetical protein DEH69_21345 [Streptomyces sp. PT12]